METILIATDFSPAAHNALVYGVELAKFLHAKVALLHVCQPILSATDMGIVTTEEELMESAEELLRKEIGELNDAGKVTIEFFVEEGLPSEVIMGVADNVKAKWIIAGMKGGGRIISRILGSTAISLSRNPNIPLIVVPEDARFTPPKAIALASDIDNETDVHIIDPLEEFGIKCNSTMYVVRVIKKGMNEVFERLLSPSRLKWHCRDLHPSFAFLNDNDVAHALNGFVKEHQVDMVAMIAHKHNFFERIFVKSDIKEMMFSTHVPLIVLPAEADTSSMNQVDERLALRHA
ncbi:MAG: universal stress protein [Segetibacter sp.]|nr:universal stress protein [Segetibacter sp.]